LVTGVVPEHEVVRARAAAEAVPEVRRAREARAPDTAVLADLLQRLDDQRVLADALRHRWQLAGLPQLGELRRFLKCLGELGGIGDHLGALELADQRALALRDRAGGDSDRERSEDERGGDPKTACAHEPPLSVPAALGDPGFGGPDYVGTAATTQDPPRSGLRRPRPASYQEPAQRRVDGRRKGVCVRCNERLGGTSAKPKSISALTTSRRRR